MNSNILLYIIVFWQIALTVGAFLLYRHYQRLSKGVGKGNLIKVLDGVLAKEKINTKAITKIKSEINRIDREGEFNIKKIGVVKYNPFKELGGDHSFAISLLNGIDSGIIITGLHTRERTRVYLREIRKGKGLHKLAAEEEKALKKALAIKI